LLLIAVNVTELVAALRLVRLINFVLFIASIVARRLWLPIVVQGLKLLFFVFLFHLVNN